MSKKINKKHAPKKSASKPSRKQVSRKQRKKPIKKASAAKSLRGKKTNNVPKTKKPLKSNTSRKANTDTRKHVSRKSPQKAKQSPKRSNTSNKPSINIQKVRGKDEIKYSFKGVKSIDKKVSLIKADSGDKLDRLIHKHEKPPRGVVVIIKGKNGKVSAKVSPVDFVVNKKNVKGFIDGVLSKVKDDFDTLQEISGRAGDDFDRLGPAEGGGDEGSDENFDPDTVEEITVKFFY